MGSFSGIKLNIGYRSFLLRGIEDIIKNDLLINRKRFDIEEKALLLIATQQPMAVDLRTIAAILSIITDLERIAERVVFMVTGKMEEMNVSKY